MRTEVVPATEEHARYLAERLRQEDIEELRAGSGTTPLLALLSSLEVSDPDMCWCALLEGEPFAMFGANHLQESVGGAWLLATPRIQEVRREAWFHSYTHVALMHERYDVLTNFIDVRNLTSILWLERLGFVPLEVFPEFGAERRPFIQYASFRRPFNV